MSGPLWANLPAAIHAIEPVAAGHYCRVSGGGDGWLAANWSQLENGQPISKQYLFCPQTTSFQTANGQLPGRDS